MLRWKQKGSAAGFWSGWPQKGFLGKGFPKGASFQQETPVKYSAGSSCVYHLARSCAYHILWLKNFSTPFLILHVGEC